MRASWLSVGGLCAALCAAGGCGVVSTPPAQTSAGARQRCPDDGVRANPDPSLCPDDVMDRFLQSVAEYAHKRWDPQRTISDPNTVVHEHGGQALMAVLGVRIDAAGHVDGVGLRRSSGVQRIDDQALDVFRKGDTLLYPPACAVSGGGVNFRVGLCVEVIPSSDFQWHPLPADSRTEEKNKI
jgi:hypothetical protein